MTHFFNGLGALCAVFCIGLSGAVAQEARESAQGATGAKPAVSQQLTALARAEQDGSEISDEGAQVAVNLRLSQAVPYRIFFLDAPRRMVVDFSEVDWTGFDAARFVASDDVTAVRVGGFVPGWSRMVIDLAQPLTLKSAEMRADASGAGLALRLAPVSAEVFAAQAGTPPEAQLVTRSASADAKTMAPTPDFAARKVRVMLDPGHGGIDPGAERAGLREADLMLTFTRELKDALVRTGRFEVFVTRDADVFVPLERRITLAREAQADVFLSLHADALSEGHAHGATVYTLAERATDLASQKLSERHDRADLLAGVDLSDHDDVIAGVLMDMARTETKPRTNRLADALVTALRDSVGVHKRPRLEAGFSVLKAPDMPSVLLELGFLSSEKDQKKLIDPAWRARAAWAVRDALLVWVEAEIVAREKLRQ